MPRAIGVTRRQVMVAAAAREISDDELVFVGMRLPLLGFALARALHAPGAIGLFENGVIRDSPPIAPIITMGDPPNIAAALSCTGLLDVMSHLQRGRVDVGFLGGAEVDRFGNLNTTWAEEGWRRAVGLVRGGPARVITSMGVFGFDPDTLEMILESVHPGVSLQEIRAQTGWPVRPAPDLRETPEPTEEELTA